MSEGVHTAHVVLLLALLAPGAVDAGAAPPEEPPVDPALVHIAIDRREPHAGETVLVSVHTLDERGEPVDVADVALDCDQGVVGALTRVRDGIHSATLEIPRALPNDRMLLLAARAGAASSERTLAVGPGPPAAIAVQGPAAVRIGTDASVQLEVRVMDAFGNGAETPPRVAAALGSVGPPRASAAGRWSIEYVPPALREDARDDLTIEAGAVRAHHALPLATTHAWLAFSPWTGVVRTDAGDTTAAVGVRAARWWRVGGWELGAVLDVGAWRLAETAWVPPSTGAPSLEDERTYVPVTAAVGWGRALGRRAAAWLTVGGGAAWISAQETLAGQPALSEAAWAPAASATAALGFRAWRGMPFLEARAAWIGDPELVTVRGVFRAGLLVVGYRFDGR